MEDGVTTEASLDTSQLSDRSETAPNSSIINNSTIKTTNSSLSQTTIQNNTEALNQLHKQSNSNSSSRGTLTGEVDLEKAESNESTEEDFDLLNYMESNGRDLFQQKELGVIFDDLTVVASSGDIKINIKTFSDAIKDFLIEPYSIFKSFFTSASPPPSKILLHSFNGFVAPGEMVLVLGKPGSGCSTFLKTIANQTGGGLSVEGKVSYGPFSSKEIASSYRGEVVYNMEDDLHHATLTVSQLIMFSLNTRAGKLQSSKELKKQVLDLILKMLAISHTKNTLVGSATIRGVSGGEKKRVSIAEMLVNWAPVCCWDNTTRGLDSSTALDFAKSLRILTNVNRVSTFVSLYQSGEGIYQQFDKVLVIDEGREIYFGPIEEARSYMVGLGYADLPRQTTSDFLTGISDPMERKFSPDVDEATIPSTPQALESAFRQSETYKRMIVAKEEFRKSITAGGEKSKQEEFIASVKDCKRNGVNKNSSYNVPFSTQVNSLIIRQFQIVLQNKLELYITFIDSAGIALITGAIYLLLPTTSAGAFTRGGVLFISVLYNAFHAFNEIPTTMLGRPIMWKHHSFTFYRPAALSIASTIAGAPISALQIFVFCIIVYFMTGLYSSAAAFFIFYIAVLSGYFALSAIFRFLGTICSSFDIAGRISAVVITSMVLYSGYLIPVFSMKRWLFWIYYINPMNYAFAATMENEFSRINLLCDGAFIIPHNIGNLTKYPTQLGSNQACILPGSTPGTAIISGSDYIRANFSYDTAGIGIGGNIAITLVFFVVFNLLQAWAVEKFKHGTDSAQINFFSKETAETVELNEQLKKNKLATQKGEAKNEMKGLPVSSKPFTWEGLSYSVPIKGGSKQLLDEVYGYCRSGELTALMGASGAGKTTLLDVLADRKSIGVISGSILMNGRKIGSDFTRSTAYVEQMDLLLSTSTIREAFRFSAYLRQPTSVSKAEKDSYVEEVIQLLELNDLADAMIGSSGFGLGVEQRKRVTIGVELCSRPSLLLFLDEPTSGLDGASAISIVKFLKKLSVFIPVLVTIHQPNSLLFEHFDRLLLLKSGGKVCYFGNNGSTLLNYLARNGAICPSNANPAEFILEAIGAGSKAAIGNQDWSQTWLDSAEFSTVKSEIKEFNRISLLTEPEIDSNSSNNEYTAPFLIQLKLVISRSTLSFYRNPSYTFSRLFNHCAIAIVLSLTFLQLSTDLVALQYRVFVIFFVTVLPAVIISQVEPMYIGNREIFIRENSSKMYSPYSFALGQIIGEMPYSLLCTICFFLLFYYPVGFNSSSNRAGYTFLMILLIEIYSVTLGQAIASISPSVFVAATLNPFILVIGSLFAGVSIPKNLIPGWLEWVYEINPFTRMISGMVSNELNGLEVICTFNEFTRFLPPSGQTCQEWAGEYITLAGGYLNSNSNDGGGEGEGGVCEYCAYKLGNDFYKNLNINFENRWRELGILFGFIILNAGVTIVAARFLKYSKR